MLMRKILLTAVSAILTALIFCTYAYADVSLYKGTTSIGAVSTIENDSGLFVPVGDVGRLLGFSVSRSGEEVLLSRGNTKIKVINNSAAAWRGSAIVPLQSTPFENNGQLWIDSHSAISLFQASAGAGAANRLRFSKISGYTVTTANANELDLGHFMPTVSTKPTTVASNINLPQKTSYNIEKSTEPQIPAKESVIPKTTPSPSSSSSSKKKQPKYEAFKLDDSKTDAGEYYNGTIQNIRWTTQEGEHKKIRAVISVNDNAEPQVYMSQKELHALFTLSYETPEKISSPYENIKLEARQNPKGIDLVFKPDRITKAEKIVLSNPRRIVFDFFFPSNVNIVSVNNAPQVVASKPVPPIQTTPTQPITKTITTKALLHGLITSSTPTICYSHLLNTCPSIITTLAKVSCILSMLRRNTTVKQRILFHW